LRLNTTDKINPWNHANIKLQSSIASQLEILRGWFNTLTRSILKTVTCLSQSRVHVPYTFWDISAWKINLRTSSLLISSGCPGFGRSETQKLRLVLYYRHLKGVLVSGVVVNINYEIKYLFLMIDNSPRWRWFYRVCGFSASKMGLKHQNTVRMTS